MELLLIRNKRKQYYIDGILYINNERFCDTDENAFTSLPAGKYTITRVMCKQYERNMPLISEYNQKPHPCCDKCKKIEDINNNSLLPCRCPMLKAGNGVHKRTDGSIIIGTRITEGALKFPQKALFLLSDNIRKAITRHHTITLEILEKPKE